MKKFIHDFFYSDDERYEENIIKKDINYYRTRVELLRAEVETLLECIEENLVEPRNVVRTFEVINEKMNEMRSMNKEIIQDLSDRNK
jgi:hypothetical protein